MANSLKLEISNFQQKMRNLEWKTTLMYQLTTVIFDIIKVKPSLRPRRTITPGNNRLRISAEILVLDPQQRTRI